LATLYQAFVRTVSRNFKIILVVIIAFIFHSCGKILDDIENAKVDFVTELGLHVADIVLFIDETIDINIDTIIEGMPQPIILLSPGEDGILKLHISQDFPPVMLDSILNLKDTAFIDTIGFPAIYGFFIEGDFSFGFQLTTFDKERFNDKKIDSIKLDGGVLKLEFNTYDQFYSEFDIVFPGITDANNDLLKIENFIPTTTNNKIEFDLKDHKIQVLEKRGKEYFLIDLDFYIESLDSEEEIEPLIKVEMGELDLDYAYGSLGYDTIPNFEKQVISMPGKLIENQDVIFDFERPQIKLHTKNGFAIPFRYDVKTFQMHFPDGTTEDVTGLSKQIFINSPTLDIHNEYVESTIALDSSTNFDLLMSKGPELLTIDGDLWTNPNNPDQKNYLRDKDSLSTRLEMDIPFSMRITEIVLRDTMQNEIFKQLNNGSFSTERLKIKTDISNSFPFDLSLQAYFYDEFDLLIDSLFSEPVKINGPDFEFETAESTLYADKEGESIKNLIKTKKVITEARFSTADADEEKIVNFRNEHELGIKLTIFTKLNVQPGNEN
jgi:hypothetical protein